MNYRRTYLNPGNKYPGKGEFGIKCANGQTSRYVKDQVQPLDYSRVYINT